MTITRTWGVATGMVLGRDHAVLRKNRQDAVDARHIGGWAIGAVADGCGEGSRSEVGAALMVAVAMATLERVARDGGSLDSAPERVRHAVVQALSDVASHVGAGTDRDRFVREHLFATLVAFAVNDGDGVAFAFGDGLVLVDDALTTVDEDNRPLYLGYELASATRAVAREPSLVVRAAGDVVAVATDGFDASSLRRAVAARGRDVSRHLVCWQRRAAFSDDGAIAIARRELSAGGEGPCAS